MTDIPTPLADLAPDDYALAFVPVPLARTRHDGFTEQRQRLFIVFLRTAGVVAAAARAVGVSAQTAYKLRARAGAEAFAAAWDRALDEGRAAAFDLAYARAVNGCWTPRFYRGRFTGTLHAYDDRLALAALRSLDRPSPSHDKGDRCARSSATSST